MHRDSHSSAIRSMCSSASCDVMVPTSTMFLMFCKYHASNDRKLPGFVWSGHCATVECVLGLLLEFTAAEEENACCLDSFGVVKGADILWLLGEGEYFYMLTVFSQF